MMEDLLVEGLNYEGVIFLRRGNVILSNIL